MKNAKTSRTESAELTDKEVEGAVGGTSTSDAVAPCNGTKETDAQIIVGTVQNPTELHKAGGSLCQNDTNKKPVTAVVAGTAATTFA